MAVGCTIGSVGGRIRSVRPDLSAHPLPETNAEEIAAAVAARNVHFDPDHTPDYYVHEHVTPQHESPIFSDLVKQGSLPPLTDRMPDDPVVHARHRRNRQFRRHVDAPGAGLGDLDTINFRLSASYLMHWSPLGYPIEPHVAKSLESSPDKRVWTITLAPRIEMVRRRALHRRRHHVLVELRGQQQVRQPAAVGVGVHRRRQAGDV